jgi:hypothetical protein
LENKKKILPPISWMIKNGYRRLYHAIRRMPELFEDFEIEKIYKTIEEHIEIAEYLAKNNNGYLPCASWLMTNGYGCLYRYIKENRGRFSHIPMEKIGKDVDYWVQYAEKLAEENNNILPCNKWLCENNLSSIPFFKSKCPDHFSHLEQEYRGGKDISYWIKEAEQMAKENGGELPLDSELRKEGYGGLVHMLRRYPKKFKHIKRKQNKLKTVEENVEIAEQLAKNNNGLLPHLSKLIKDGHGGIAHMLYRHPDKFKHIKRDFKTCRTVDDQVEIADNLAKNNNGLLPEPKWLKNNGHWGLSQLTYRNPEKFSHLKQEFKGGVRIIGEE